MSQTLAEWLSKAPFSLALSSGFFGFFAHAGFMRALDDAGLKPARITGSSAGSLIAGAYASGVSGEELCEELRDLRREEFWDPWVGAGLLRGGLFRDRLERLLKAKTFEETEVPLTISVFDIYEKRTRLVESGKLSPVIQASCCFPLLFHPVWLGARPTIDGGVADRPALDSMQPGERVLAHHLVSRSPWRRSDDPSAQVPARPGLIAVAIDDLPRLGPFRLEAGAEASELAYRAAKEALARPVSSDGDTVRLSVT